MHFHPFLVALAAGCMVHAKLVPFQSKIFEFASEDCSGSILHDHRSVFRTEFPLDDSAASVMVTGTNWMSFPDKSGRGCSGPSKGIMQEGCMAIGSLGSPGRMSCLKNNRW